MKNGPACRRTSSGQVVDVRVGRQIVPGMSHFGLPTQVHLDGLDRRRVRRMHGLVVPAPRLDERALRVTRPLR
jgi:hypothetical protein